MQELKFRLAVLADAEMLFQWRNHPRVRQYSGSPHEIAWDDHCNWLQKSLENPNRILLIVEAEGQPVGVLRYDFQTQQPHAFVSIYLNPQKIGQGYGANLLLAGVQWIQNQHPAVQKLIAEILPDNAASIRAFEKAGYGRNRELSNPEVLVYEYVFP